MNDSPVSGTTPGRTVADTASTIAPLAWWVRVLIALGFLGLLVVDPLNAGSGSGQRSEQAVLRIVSPFYDASRQVTVVLIDDAFLARIGSGWPMSYREQGLLLRRILAHEPAAVFVDLLYRHRHGREASDDDPLDLLRPLPGATDQPIPVLFAALSVEQPGAPGTPRGFCLPKLPATGLYTDRLVDPRSIEPALRAPFGISPVPPSADASTRTAAVGAVAATGPRPGVALVSWSGCGNAYPLLLGGSRNAPTPAMAMFDATCRRRPALAACDFGGRAPLEVAQRFMQPMIVRWGAFAARSQEPFYAAGVCQRATNAEGGATLTTRVWRALQQLALGAVFNLRADDDPEVALPCPAVAVIPADAIVDGDAATVDALLRDRAVMIGAKVSGIPDWQLSGVHGLVPGVVLHAMALDNLLVRGASYLKPMSRDGSRFIMLALACGAALLAPWVVARKPWFRESTRAATGLALWIGYALVLAAHRHWLEALAVLGVATAFDLIKPAETFRLALLFALMSALAVLAVVAGRSPWNWIGLAFVVLATTETLKAYLKGGAPKPFPHPQSLLRAAWQALRERTVQRRRPDGAAPDTRR